MRGTAIFPVALLLVSLTITFHPMSGEAQRGAKPRVAIAKLNHKAMAAYANLQFQEAMQLLRNAEAQCAEHNVRGTTLARLYLSMGIVEIGGNQNNASALKYFKRAICLDSSLMLDPLNSTPEIESVFENARVQTQARGVCQRLAKAPRSGGGAAPRVDPVLPASGGSSEPLGEPVVGPGVEVMRHSPVASQARMVPIPIFTEINPTLQVGQVVLFYRTLGERIFQQVVMRQHGSGYAVTIGCDVLQTFDPSGIEYYIVARNPENQLLGTSGTEARPHRVNVVKSLSGSVPTLPNTPPPSACQEECPPWNPDCNKNCKQSGQMCDTSSECCSGLVCVHESCTPADDEDLSSGSGGKRGKAIARLGLSAGTGIGYIPAGKYAQADVADMISPGDLDVPAGFAWAKFHTRANLMIYITPDLQVGAEFRGDLALDPNGAKPIRPGVLANLAYRFVGDRVGSGFELYGVFGLGGGVFQHRVEFKDCPAVRDDQGNIKCNPQYVDPNTGQWDQERISEKKAFFRESGKFIAELGIDMYFWFGKYVGLKVGIMFNLLAPEFAINADAGGGLAFRF